MNYDIAGTSHGGGDGSVMCTMYMYNSISRQKQMWKKILHETAPHIIHNSHMLCTLLMSEDHVTWRWRPQSNKTTEKEIGREGEGDREIVLFFWNPSIWALCLRRLNDCAGGIILFSLIYSHFFFNMCLIKCICRCPESRLILVYSSFLPHSICSSMLWAHGHTWLEYIK